MLQIKSKHEVKEATLHQTIFISAFCIDEGGKHKQGENLAQAQAWEICSAGQCGQNRRCFQGIPFHVFL